MISRLKKIGRDFSLLLSAHTTQDKAIARNWIWHEDISTFWIKKYIDLKFPEHKKVCFFSCFDPRIRLAQFYPGVKIFYSGENLQSDAVRPGLPAAWRDARVAEVDLSIGFEFRKEPRTITDSHSGFVTEISFSQMRHLRISELSSLSSMTPSAGYIMLVRIRSAHASCR